MSAMATMQSDMIPTAPRASRMIFGSEMGRLDTNPNDRGVQRRAHHPVWMTVIENAAR